MKKIFDTLLSTSIISSLVLIAFGISLIVQVETTIVAISYILGGVLALLGLVSALKYIKDSAEKDGLNIIYAMVCFILGILIIKNPFAIQNAILFVVGLIILFNSATKLQYGIELKKANNEIYLPTIIISVLMAICGIFLMFRPDIATNIFGKIIGSLIVVYAILDLITTVVIKNSFKKMNNTIKEAKIEDIKEIESNTEKKSRKEKKNDDND